MGVVGRLQTTILGKATRQDDAYQATGAAPIIDHGRRRRTGGEGARFALIGPRLDGRLRQAAALPLLAAAALRIEAGISQALGPTAPRVHWESHQINYLPRILSSRCSRNLMTSRAVVYYKPPHRGGTGGGAYLQVPPTSAMACLSEQVWASKTAGAPASLTASEEKPPTQLSSSRELPRLQHH